jgi:autotransporter-associated beta strand protein
VNYFGKFDAKVSDALGHHPSAHLFSESVHGSHVPSNAIVVSDAHLLFNAEFKRAGVDLVLSGDGREVVLHDYFKGEHRAPIASPDGAHLTGNIVTALAGEVQLAQADGNADAHKIIGHVSKLVGTATAIRNGVSIILNNGDNVEKGDVVASGSDSTLGITFIDGTVFGLSSNARMVLNEMVYDPNGSNNSSLLSLVAGTITFVAGETAKHGDMKVDTPVATMGIRGTACLVEIDYAVPALNAQPNTPVLPEGKFQVLVEPDGTTGSYILYDKQTLTPLAVVDQAGHQINISNGIASQTLVPLSPEVQKLIQDVFTLKFSDSSDTKSTDHFTDVVIQLPLQSSQFPIGSSVAPVVPVTLSFSGTATGGGSGGTPSGPPHFHVAPTLLTTNGFIVERPFATGGIDTISGTLTFKDINLFDRPTVTVHSNSFTLLDAQGKDITSTLSAEQIATIQALEDSLTLSANPGNTNNGVDTWNFSVAASALNFLPPGSTLTLNYNAIVNNNFGPDDLSSTAPFTITIKVTGEIWSETEEIASPAPHDWATGANWLPGVAPTASDDVLIVTDPAKSGTPVYPVIINAEGPAAFANSVTMSDLGDIAPELDNYNTLTIGSGGLHLNADSILRNFGNLSVGGIAEILQHSVLQNSGAMKLLEGGEFKDQSSITNSGKIELAGGTLNVEVDVANKGGTLQIDDSTTLKLSNGATISHGAMTLGAGSVLDVESAAGATLDGVAVTGTDDNETLSIPPSIVEIGVGPDGASTLTMLDGASIANGFMTIGFDSVLDVESALGATLDDVAVTSSGTIEIGAKTEGGSTLTVKDGASVVGSDMTIAAASTLDVESALGAALDGVTVTGTGGETPSTIEIGVSTDGGSILMVADGTSITNGNMTIAAASKLDVESSLGATLDGVTVTGTNGESPSTIEIGSISGSVLHLLDGTSITYGDIKIAANSVLDIESAGGATLNDVNVANSGTIQVDGGGPTVTLVLDGGTTITGGELLIHDPESTGEGIVEIETGGATFSDVTVTNNNELIIDAMVTLTLTDNTSILGGTIDDIGTLLVSSASEIDGATIDGGGGVTVTGGTLTLSEVTLDDVTLSGSFTNHDMLTIDETVTLNGATIASGTIDDTGTLSGFGAIGSDISGSGAVTATGGTLTLTGDNTYAGVTTIDSDGTLALSGNGSIATSSGVVDNGTFDIAATTSGASVKRLSGDGTVTLGTETLTLTDASTTFDGSIGGAGGVTLAAGAETLTGNNTYSGTTTIDTASTLALSGSGSIAASSDVVDNGTFDIAGTSGASIVTLSGDGTVNLGANTLTLTKGSTTFSGVINGTGGLTVNGTGTETLTGNNSYTGATTIGSGETLALSGSGSISASSNVVDNGTFDIVATSGASIVTLSGTGKVNLGANTLTLTKGSTTFSGVINGTGGLTVDGSGTETLSGVSTYTGVTTIGSGETLALLAGGSIANSSDVVDDGTFDISGTTSGASIKTLSGDGSITLGTKTLTLTNGSTTFSGAINGTGGLTVNGTGTETLKGNNSYTGATTIGSGETLVLSGSGSISASSNVVDNGTFDISGTTSGASIVTLSGSGTVNLGSKTLTLTDASTTFSGAIDGTGGGVTVATGTLTFGTVTLDDLTLSGSFAEAATMTIDDTVTLNSATISGGTIDIAGTLDSTGTSLISGATIINPGDINVVSGTLTIDPAPFTNTGTIEVDGSATLVLTGETVTNSVTVGLTTTNGTIQVDHSGLLKLNGDTINGGIVDDLGTIDVTAGSSINNSFSFTNTGTVNADGAALTLSGTTVSNSGGTLESTGSGLLKLVNATINSGTLAGKIATATGNSSSTLNGITLAAGSLVTAVVGALELTGIITNNGEFDAGTGATLGLDNVTVNGGTLGGSGTIVTAASSFDTLNGITIAHGTTVTGADGTTLDLVGTITDRGTIALGSSGHTTQLEISGNVSLTGGGNVTMTDNADNFIVSDGSAAALTNSDTISGAGTIGDSHLTLINSGTIDATGTHPLIINTGVTNNAGGVLEASSGATLDINGNVVNDGLIEAKSSASVMITGNVTNSVGHTGNIEIFSNASAEITGSVSSGQTVTFEQFNGDGLLVLDDSHDFKGTIAGLTEASSEDLENKVDLRDLAWHKGQMHVSFDDGRVTVSYVDDHKTIDSVTLNVSGNSSGEFEITSDGHGGTLLDDPSATGTVTVDSDQVLGISAASSATIDFTNSTGNTGELLLNDSKDFTGTIVGFAGDGTTANSDLIDVTDINFANVATNKTTYTENAAGTGGTLTLYDANGQVLDNINFTGNYQLANFTIENDGNGGTLIVDPPVNSTAQTTSSTIVVGSSDETLTGSASSDNFVFNFAGTGHSTIANFGSAADLTQFSSSLFANLQSIPNTAHADGHGSSVIAIDAHDGIALNGLLKAQPHASDFHLV